MTRYQYIFFLTIFTIMAIMFTATEVINYYALYGVNL